MASTRGTLLAGGVALVAALWWAAAEQHARWTPEAEVAGRPIEHPRAGYVTSDGCRACHPSEYARWHGSHHRTMTQVASPETVVGDFGDVQLVHAGIGYRLRREHDAFLVDVLAGGRVRTLEVALTTGAHHQQVYWVSTGAGRALGALPFAWLVADGRWVPLDSIFVKDPEAVRASPPGEWNHTCVRCHTTHQRPRAEGFDPIDSQVSEFGIACEACHGPAEEHVRANRDPLRRYGLHLEDAADPTIVHPERLDHVRSAQVCAQCHAVTLRDAEEHERWHALGHSYRPGDDLDATQHVVRRGQDSADLRAYLAANPDFLDERFWSDGMIRVAGREYNGLVETACFQRGTMSCSSCHAMHAEDGDARPMEEWADDQLRFGGDADRACVGCHAELVDGVRLTEHTHHAAGSSGSSCVNCHMPHTSYSLMKATRSHQVDSPDVAVTLRTGRPNACNLCHLDRSLGWVARRLEDWYDAPGPTLPDDDVAASVRWLLTGDAGQRALVAWSFGWRPAREASGDDWLAPYLAHLLEDPYPAVRYVAARALETLPAAEGQRLDHLASDGARERMRAQVTEAWRATRRLGSRPALLLGPDGALDEAAFAALAAQRDDRVVTLAE